jgi:hypothetical protein
MKFPRRVARHARLAAPAAALAWLSLPAFFSCSSDPASTLGSDSDLLGSEPGDVYQDTIGVFADTVYTFDTPIASDPALEVGRLEGYARTMLLQPGFSGLTDADKSRVVESASLRLVPGTVSGSFPVRFYRLSGSYTEGKGVAALDTVYAIVDPTTGSPNRLLESAQALHPLPPALVQGWLRGDSVRVAIAVVYTDAVNDRVATYPSKDAGDDSPLLQVNFVGGIQKSYAITHDATRYDPLASTSNLIVSDGQPRRVYLRANLDEVPDEAAVHTARIRLHIVPGSELGSGTTLVVYIPATTDSTSADFKGGQPVTEKDFTAGDETIEFTLTNAIFLTLQGSLDDNGFVIRFLNENTELRQVEFYGTAAVDSLRPRVFITSSTPAEFGR